MEVVQLLWRWAALISIASNSNGPSWVKTIGNISGEYTHQLTTEALPNFRLKNGFVEDSEGNSLGVIYAVNYAEF